MKRSTLWTVLASFVVLAMLLGACAPAATPTPPAATQPQPAVSTEAPAQATEAPAAGTPKMGGTLTFGMKEDVTSLDPLKAIQYGDIRLNILVAQQLVAPDRNGKFVGVLAERWDTSPDGKEWTFYLRKGVKFHNGQEMKADDVKWIFDHILDENSGAVMRSTYAGIGLKVDVVDDYTVKMTINSGMGPFLSYLSLLNRSAIIHRDSYNADGSVTKIIGTGPFMMSDYKPGEYYNLVKFPDYWKKGQPYLDEVVLKVLTDPNVRENALRTGEIDMTEDLPMSDVKNLVQTQDPNFYTNVYYINSDNRLVLNQTRAPFNNLDARLAVEYAFDRDAYNEAVYFGLGQVHNQPFVPTDVWYLKDVPMIKPDLQKAKEHFQAAGLKEGAEITMLLMPSQKDAAEIIDSMLSQVGFKVNFETVDSAAWTSKGQKYDFDLLLGTMTGVFDPDRPYGYLTKNSGSNWLVGGYSTPEMDQLLSEGTSETDPAMRNETYTKVLNMVQDQAATMYLVGLPWVEAWRTYVKGYQSGTSPALMMMDASDGLNVTWLDK